MPRIVSALELLQDVLPGKPQALKFTLPGSLRWRQCDAIRAGFFGSVRLLSLHGFAFPASRHKRIIGRFALRPLRPFFACFAAKTFEAFNREDRNEDRNDDRKGRKGRKEKTRVRGTCYPLWLAAV